MYLGEAIFGKYNVIQNMGISRAVILPSFIKLQKLYFSSQEPACEGTKGGGVGWKTQEIWENLSNQRFWLKLLYLRFC